MRSARARAPCCRPAEVCRRYGDRDRVDMRLQGARARALRIRFVYELRHGVEKVLSGIDHVELTLKLRQLGREICLAARHELAVSLDLVLNRLALRLEPLLLLAQGLR